MLVGVEELDGVKGLPPLVEGETFAAGLFATPEAAGRLTIVGPPKEDGEGDRVAAGKATIADGDAEVAVCFPEGFGAQLAELRARLVEGADDEVSLGEIQSALGRLSVLFNAAREPSQVAGLRVEQVLSRWRQAVIQENLAAGNVPISVTSPFQVSRIDVAPKESRDALLWSKLLPFIVFIWALTGAFYPAIDLCAGEKERGTLETLLASPARRSEIVGGKLLTVMTFSIFTACLNLASLALTAKVLMNQLTGVLGGAAAVAPPSAAAIFWILVALVPIGALFSALSLACAAYARSTKEGQYYFMPLFLAATPLMLVPMSPGVELNLGNSLVPVMGLVLLLRAMIEGQLATAALYAGPVVAVTAVCCWLAMRWAVSQFNQESVLFRESERFDLRGQLRAMVRRRGETPSAAAAMACVGGVFLVQFVVRSIPALASARVTRLRLPGDHDRRQPGGVHRGARLDRRGTAGPQLAENVPADGAAPPWDGRPSGRHGGGASPGGTAARSVDPAALPALGGRRSPACRVWQLDGRSPAAVGHPAAAGRPPGGLRGACVPGSCPLRFA